MSMREEINKTKEYVEDIYSMLAFKGATSIPDEKNIKNIAQTINSIKVGGDGETEKPQQTHNYLMLYDGTLGEAGANGVNVCADVTGGWELNMHVPSNHSKGTANLGSNSLYLETIYKSSAIMSTFTTANSIDIEGFEKIAIISNVEFVGLSTTTWNGSFLGDKKTCTSTNGHSESVWLGFPTSNLNFVRSASLSTLNGKNFYLQGYISATDRDGIAKCAVYGMFIVKKDNYQPVLDLAGIKNAYTDENDICADESAINMILNSEEAIKYMIYNCTGTFMLAFIQSTTAMACLNNSLNKTILYGNEVWLKFLIMLSQGVKK